MDGSYSGHMASLSRLGVLLCLGSGAAFAVQPVLGARAIAAGAELESLLGWRYALAAVVLTLIGRKRLRTLGLRPAIGAFAIGLVLYTADSLLFYSALERSSAPFASLLHYAHLVLVVGVAAAVGSERLTPRRAAALVTILTGVALVGAGGTRFDLLALGLALGSAAVYGVSILAVGRLLHASDPIAASAAMTTGTAVAFLALGGISGNLFEIGGATGVAVAVVGALLGSVFAMTALVAAIRLLGAGTASLLVTIEVPIGLVLAALVLDVRLTAPQLFGAVLVVGAIALLQIPLPRVSRAMVRIPRAVVARLAFGLSS